MTTNHARGRTRHIGQDTIILLPIPPAIRLPSIATKQLCYRQFQSIEIVPNSGQSLSIIIQRGQRYISQLQKMRGFPTRCSTRIQFSKQTFLIHHDLPESFEAQFGNVVVNKLVPADAETDAA